MRRHHHDAISWQDAMIPKESHADRPGVLCCMPGRYPMTALIPRMRSSFSSPTRVILSMAS